MDQGKFDHTTSGYLNNDFRTCLHHLMEHGLEAHPRGTTTRELLNYNITLKDPRNRVIMFPERNTNTKYLLGELIKFMLHSQVKETAQKIAERDDGIFKQEISDNTSITWCIRENKLHAIVNQTICEGV